MKTTHIDDLTYEWPSNLSQYEAKIFLGLTATEAMGSAMAFLLPTGTMRSGMGFFVGLICCLVVLLSIKKIERFGNRSVLVYLAQRTYEKRTHPEIELPLIMGGSSARVELESWEGETLITFDGSEGG